MRRQTLVFWVGLAALLILVGFLSGRQRADGPPLDPASTNPLGTKALTELVSNFGTEVRRGIPTSDTDVAIILSDRLTRSDRQALRSWVRDGGRLIVADPGSELSPGLADLAQVEELDRGNCSLAFLEDVRTLAGSSFGRYNSSAGDDACFSADGRAFLVSEAMGSGQVISLGGGVVFTNQNLSEADNAVLAVRLLTRRTDGGSELVASELAVIYDPGAVGGDQGLNDLIPRRVRWFGWQLLVGFGLYVLWRIRRFGAVVQEPQVVEMPGSLLVRATGELSRRTGGHAAAGDLLRVDLERRLRTHHRIAPDTGQRELVAVVAQRTGCPRELLERVLVGPLPIGGTELTRLLVDIDTLVAIALPQPSATTRDTPDSSPRTASPTNRSTDRSTEGVLQ